MLKRFLQRFGISRQKRYRHTVKFEGVMTPLSRASSFYGGGNASGGGSSFYGSESLNFVDSTPGASFFSMGSSNAARGNSEGTTASGSSLKQKISEDITWLNENEGVSRSRATSSRYDESGCSVTTDLQSL